MNKAKFLFLLSLISLLWKGADIKCSAPIGVAPEGPSFAETKVQIPLTMLDKLRQNDFSRFHELMGIQNEQMNILKNAMLSMEEV
ncbi:hypothetical protein C922_00166 [Plasmodium inui San Antonio 1]|uniref:Uncharacterized protein n=1 Tax=Plasmodium inui San Antonio 1 TaxID=1237626 RepID=W7ADA0_9APIC|nr:hypothetical protein C922_00166 [Plasmodium inui San Antonio 1]EUD69303.1 hypothetical protein C922_00166 [Plasmodium inui San Antonio 1]